MHIDELVERFELAYRRGERPRVEDYLAGVPGPVQSALLRELRLVERELEAKRSGRGNAASTGPYPPDPSPGEYQPNIPIMGAAKAPYPLGPIVNPFPDDYVDLEWVGGGSYGVVFRARQQKMGNSLVALKTLKPGLNSVLRSLVLAALQHEAAVLGQLRVLKHRNIVTVFEWKEAGANPWLVLEYVDGGSLEDRLRREGALAWEIAARYIADVGEGLLMLHARNIVHRDIKPSNILVDRGTDEARLTDFGVAAHLRNAGGWAGTIAFMAPEVLPPNHVQPTMWPRADVYSLAATLFHLITGEPPFPVKPRGELPRRIRAGLPVNDPRFGNAPAPLRRVIRDGLTADRILRPELRDFVGRLRRALNHILADSLPEAEGERPRTLNMRLHVSRALAGSRNMRPVVAAGGDLIRVHTGDRLRIEVAADRPGFVTVFNVGPTGDLCLLYPDEPPAEDARPNLQPGEPLHVGDVDLEPPAGYERLVAIWTRQRVPLPLGELARQVMEGDETPVSEEYRASRVIAAVRGVLRGISTADWGVVVRILEHVEEECFP